MPTTWHAMLAEVARAHGMSPEAQADVLQLLERVASVSRDRTVFRPTDPDPVSLQAEATYEMQPTTRTVEGRAEPGARYADRGRIGKGGTAEVRRVHDRDLNRTIAMKIIDEESVSAVVHRFLEEAQVTAQLEHPAIVPVHEFGRRPDGRLFFTMREVRGRTLHHVIRAGTTPFEALLDIFATVCDAVGYAHAKGVIHRDLKPLNIMVGSHGEVYVVDWGLAMILQDADSDRITTRVRHVAGTPGYMSPEQVAGDPSDFCPQSDVFALGAVLFQILTGARPYSGLPTEETFRRTREDPPPALPEDAPPSLAALAIRCMQRGIADRPANASEVAAEIRRFQYGVEQRERASTLVGRALDQAKQAQEELQRSVAASARAVELSEAIPATAPVAEKQPLWEAEDTRDAHARRARELGFEHLQGLRAALLLDGQHPDAHEALAAWHRGAHERAEASGDGFAAAEHEQLIRMHDRVGAHAAYLVSEGTLCVRTDRPALATLLRVEVQGRRATPVYVRRLGQTPIEDAVLAQGSWLVLLEPEVGPTTRLMVRIDRGSRCVHDLVLPESLPPDTCFVPGGRFPAGGDGEVPCLPRTEVLVAPFVMERFPVTNQRFRLFLDALVGEGREADALEYCPRVLGGDRLFGRGPDGGFTLQADSSGDPWHDGDPIVMVDFEGAREFAAWRRRETGLPWRLPSEYEWEKAARGVDGRAYPWGDHPDSTWMCVRDSHLGNPRPPPVVAFPLDESPYGVRGLAGGVRDWCLDAGSPAGPELGPSGENRIPTEAELSASVDSPRSYRGGDWYGLPVHARSAYRAWNKPVTRNYNLGFRLVYSVS